MIKLYIKYMYSYIPYCISAVFLYKLRHTIYDYSIRLSHYAVDKYIDLKWKLKLGLDTEHLSVPHKLDRCPVVELDLPLPYTAYQYGDMTYITPHALSPICNDIDVLYGSETIDTIVYTYKDKDNKLYIYTTNGNENKFANKLITQLAGPLLDFHEKVPKLVDIVALLLLTEWPIDGLNIDNIVITTEYFKSYRIE